MAGKTLTVFFFTIFLLGTITRAEAVLIGGVEFPDGEISFADSVYSYTQGTGGVGVDNSDPTNALGVPDYDGADNTFVSLGDGGSLTLQFTDNYLTTSGDSGDDLWIFEIGSVVEATAIYISTDGVDWISVGSVGGSTAGVDLDSFYGSGVVDGELYSYVRLVDLTTDASSASPWTGADIDAVGAISTIAADPEPEPTPVPEPSTMLLLVAGLFGLGLFRAKLEPSI